MPSSRQARTIRTAISPRLATSTRRSVEVWVTAVMARQTARSRTTPALGQRAAVLAEDRRPRCPDTRIDVVHQLHHLDDAHGRRTRRCRRRRRRGERPDAASARRCLATGRARRRSPPEGGTLVGTSSAVSAAVASPPGSLLSARGHGSRDRGRRAGTVRGWVERWTGAGPNSRRSRPSRSVRRHRRLP